VDSFGGVAHFVRTLKFPILFPFPLQHNDQMIGHLFDTALTAM
jgi:hypothetical protein